MSQTAAQSLSRSSITPCSSITVVIVTYNSAQVLPQCLGALDWAETIVVVDNASSDASAAVAAQACPRAKVIRNSRNLGFGTACNQGADLAKGEFILFLNPDAVLERPAIEGLLAAQKQYDAAVVAPLLLDATGHPELRSRDLVGFDNHYSNDPKHVPAGPACMAFLTGAVLLWRRSDWIEIGGFDEKIFLFWEDFDLCLRTFNAAKQMILVPDVIAHHLGGRSTPPTQAVRWLKEWHMVWGDLYIRAKHGDPALARARAKAAIRKHGWLALQALLTIRRRRLNRNLAAVAGARAFLRQNTQLKNGM